VVAGENCEVGNPGTLGMTKERETFQLKVFLERRRFSSLWIGPQAHDNRSRDLRFSFTPVWDLAAVDYSGLHHEGNVLQHADVVEGIAGHGDDVGIVAGLEGA
jgi:hypothetical protein